MGFHRFIPQCRALSLAGGRSVSIVLHGSIVSGHGHVVRRLTLATLYLTWLRHYMLPSVSAHERAKQSRVFRNFEQLSGGSDDGQFTHHVVFSPALKGLKHARVALAFLEPRGPSVAVRPGRSQTASCEQALRAAASSVVAIGMILHRGPVRPRQGTLMLCRLSPQGMGSRSESGSNSPHDAGNDAVRLTNRSFQRKASRLLKYVASIQVFLRHVHLLQSGCKREVGGGWSPVETPSNSKVLKTPLQCEAPLSIGYKLVAYMVLQVTVL